MSEDDPKPPIDYRNYVDDRFERRRHAGAFIGGMLPGAFIIVIWGCLNFSIPEPPTFATPKHHVLVAALGCDAIASGVIGALMLRGPRRRFFLAGFLLGMSLTCIMEGICYFG